MRNSAKILLIDHSLAALCRGCFRTPEAPEGPPSFWEALVSQLRREHAAFITTTSVRPWLRQKKGRGAQ
jgi:hypothetical protein